ncbi:MAG: NADH-quinone oxidoreductase subunit C [Sphaerochaetaceae bacterium]|nr:NADH-quinone oxidoreductase subunit C [Sphaerochaetaceae bacterium]
MQQILDALKQSVMIEDVRKQRDDLVFITVSEAQAVSAITHLRDRANFTHLVILTAVDWLEEGLFQLTYLLNNPAEKKDIGVRVMIDREKAQMESIHHLWPAAATYQRELREMFGISFPGSPRLNETFILDEGWDGPPPYRRDFDTLKYSEETYFPRPGRSTNDPAEYMKSMLYPEVDND